MEDNFFELGGNSLLGMKLVARTVKRFAVPLRVLAVFQYPTIAEMAQLVELLLRGGLPDLSSHELMEDGSV